MLKEAISKNYIIIIITNQAGIGRGYYTEKDFSILNSYMIKVFEDKGIKITKVFFSPYHPEFGIGKYKKNHSVSNQVLSSSNVYVLEMDSQC